MTRAWIHDASLPVERTSSRSLPHAGPCLMKL